MKATHHACGLKTDLCHLTFRFVGLHVFNSPRWHLKKLHHPLVESPTETHKCTFSHFVCLYFPITLKVEKIKMRHLILSDLWADQPIEGRLGPQPVVLDHTSGFEGLLFVDDDLLGVRSLLCSLSYYSRAAECRYPHCHQRATFLRLHHEFLSPHWTWISLSDIRFHASKWENKLKPECTFNY